MQILSKPIFPQSICLVLVIVIVAHIAYKIVHTKSSSSLISVTHIGENAGALNRASRMNVRTTFRRHLFGEYIPEDLNNASIQPSTLNLNLNLVGIIYAEQEKDSQVIMRTLSGEDMVYSLGDSLPGGATIKRITSEGVLLGKGGALERLSLPKHPYPEQNEGSP